MGWEGLLMVPSKIMRNPSIKVLSFLLINILFISISGYCQYGVPYEVSGLTLYPMGENVSDLVVVGEEVKIQIQNLGVYHNTSTYIINNKGKEVKHKLGFYLIRPNGDNVSDLEVPKDIFFMVNEQKVPFIIDPKVVEEAKRRIEQFYYLDVVFPENTTAKIVFSYISNAQTIACVEGNIRLSNSLGMNRGNPYTLIIEIQNDVSYRISDIFFASGEWYHLLDSITGLSTSVGDDFSFYKLGGNKWMLKFNDRFVKKYSDEFYINIAKDEPESPFFVFYPDGLDIGLSGVWLASDPEKGNLSKRKLSKYELFFYTKQQLVLLRNCFYARYGYKFKDKQLYDYFMSLNDSPAVGRYTIYKVNPKFSESMFNDIERENIKIIRELEAMSDKMN